MFEGTLVESRGLGGTGTGRWTALGSLTLQCGLAALVLAIPLLRPESLRVTPRAPVVASPVLRRATVPVEMKRAAASGAVSLPAAAAQASAPATRRFEFRPGASGDAPEPATVPLLPMGAGGGGDPLSAIATIGTPAAPVAVRARDAAPARVSKGVSAGLLLTPIQPVYPAIAKAVRVEGTVVVEAVISKTGRVESVNVVSGPEMLRNAAREAVEAARYRPYLLNGEPAEVKTTYTVVFSLGD